MMRNLFFKLIRYSGLPFICRELLQRDKVTILLFHDISKATAVQAFSYIRRHYHVIGLQAYLKAVASGHPLPGKAVIITFDDGHVGNYELLSVLRRLQIPATIFLCSDIVATHRHFWFKHAGDDCQRLKTVPNDSRLEQLKARGFDQEREYKDAQALSREQIDEMRDCVDFQSHTCFHPVLPQCDDATARAEISLSKKHLEDDFSLNINSFSFPNGDYTTRDIRLVREEGYSCAITLEPGYNDLSSDLFRLKRLSVNEAASMDEFIVKASGCFALIKQFLRGIKLNHKHQ